MAAESAPRPAAARPGATVRRGTVPDYLPARMVNAFVYCPRSFFYEWVEGLFAHNPDTVEGALRHEALDARPGALPAAGEAEAAERLEVRAVEVASERLGVIARIDVVEAGGGVVRPVDYKKGAPRAGPAGPEPWPADRVQVGVQALLLRDNGYACDEAVLYYSATRQRVRVPVDEALVADTLAAIAGARAVAARGELPPPLVDSPKCPRCSLVTICLPDETAAAAAAVPDDGQLSLFGPAAAPRAAPPAVRRLVPARDDLRPLYLTGHGLTVGKSGEVLQVRAPARDGSGPAAVQEVRIGEISQVCVFGNVQLTTAAVQGLCEAERPIAWFSYGGWFYGLTQGLGLKNVFLRRAQFRHAEVPAFALALARELVANKIRNQRTLLRRNHAAPPGRALRDLRRCAELARRAAGLDELLGIEGTAARIYFGHFAGMLKAEDAEGLAAFDVRGRNRRPPTDPVNALLSFGYALLTKDLTVTCAAVGFDPFVGFYHQPRFGRPALALDLMESFRPLVADSAVLTAINGRMVTPADFIRAGDAVALRPAGRKAFVRAYEQRLDTLVTHPLFGYRVSYRRVFEIQARLLARVLLGEIPRYPGFETR